MDELEVVVAVRLKGGQLREEVEEAKSDDVKLSDKSNTPRLMHVHKKLGCAITYFYFWVH